MNIEIANRLGALRKEKGLSQGELAEKLGISRQAVSKWECGEASPDTENLIALAQLYQISLDELFNLKKVETKKKPIIKELLNEAFALIIVLIYLSIGFCFDLWHPTWAIFLLIPLYYVLANSKSILKLINAIYPLLMTGLYIVIGLIFNIWHPTWLVFLTIPLYYIIVETIEKNK